MGEGVPLEILVGEEKTLDDGSHFIGLFLERPIVSGDLAGAVDALLKATDLQPRIAGSFVELARVYHAAGDFVQAEVLVGEEGLPRAIRFVKFDMQ